MLEWSGGRSGGAYCCWRGWWRALFGWNILVRNLTVGALFGYSSVNSTLSLKVPSSHAVSSGLWMRAGRGERGGQACGPPTPGRGLACRPW